MSKNKLICDKNDILKLELLGLLVPKKHWHKISTITRELWINTILESYKDRFLFQFDRTRYIRDTYFLSIAQIAYFDHKLSVLLDSEIFLLERNLTQVMTTSINCFLNSRIFLNQNRKPESFNLTIEELLKGENKKVFLRLFNKQNTMIRKDIFSFLDYVATNNEIINAKSSVSDLFISFSKNRRCSVTKTETTIKILTDILQSSCDINNLTLTECLLEYSTNIKKFLIIYEEYFLKNILDKLSKRSTIKEIKKRTIKDVIEDLSLGGKIDIFDTLNEDVKSDITSTYFSQINAKIDDYEKASTFIQTLRILQKVRNKCCHTKRIYDYVTHNDKENEKVIKFLNINGVYGFNRTNRISLWGVVESICILNGTTLTKKSDVKTIIMKMITKIDFSLLPYSVKTLMIKQFKMDEWFDYSANKIKNE